jgi:hypothetical protein
MSPHGDIIKVARQLFLICVFDLRFFDLRKSSCISRKATLRSRSAPRATIAVNTVSSAASSVADSRGNRARDLCSHPKKKRWKKCRIAKKSGLIRFVADVGRRRYFGQRSGYRREAMRPEDKAEISARFKELRHRAHMTQLELVHLIGIGRQAVSGITSQLWKRSTCSPGPAPSTFSTELKVFNVSGKHGGRGPWYPAL